MPQSNVKPKRKPIDRRIELFNEYRLINASAWYVATRLKANAEKDPKHYAKSCIRANAIYSYTLDRLANFQRDPGIAMEVLDAYAVSPMSEFVAFCASLEC